MNITETILNEWKVREFPEIFPREFNIHKYIYSKLNKIVVLSGFRRVGKTYLLLIPLSNVQHFYKQ